MLSYTSVISVIIVIFFITILHELGHFTAARLFNVKVKSFVCGIGPSIWEIKDKNDIKWKFGLIPLAGYVEFDDKTNSEKDIIFDYIHPFKKFIIAFAGPLINILLSLIIFQIYRNGISSLIEYIQAVLNKIFCLKVHNNLKSPIGVISDIDISNFQSIALFTAKISASVGIINLIPFLFVLDGGHMLVYTYECIFGLNVKSRQFIARISHIQMYMLFILGILLMIRDIYMITFS